jgi:quinol monooxygenase YgiN
MNIAQRTKNMLSFDWSLTTRTLVNSRIGEADPGSPHCIEIPEKFRPHPALPVAGQIYPENQTKKGENEMAIKVIVELQAKPGKRAQLKTLLASVAAALGPGEPGFLGSTRYEVIDNPNILVEIADWESAEVRAAAMQKAMSSGAYAPLGDLLAAPFRATVISQLP